MAAPGTTGSHSTLSCVIRLFLAQPLDVIRSIRLSYESNNVYVLLKIQGTANMRLCQAFYCIKFSNDFDKLNDTGAQCTNASFFLKYGTKILKSCLWCENVKVLQ